jgi:hypothetical protein
MEKVNLILWICLVFSLLWVILGDKAHFTYEIKLTFKILSSEFLSY